MSDAQASRQVHLTPPHTTSPEVNAALATDPAWEGIRQTIAAVRAAGRAYLFGQAWLGWQLAVLKKEHHGANKGGQGGDRKSTGRICPLISWPEIVQAETGLSRRTADVFIQLFDATQAKLKRRKEDPGSSLVLFRDANPLALPPEQREALQDVIASLCDGETQASLMAELGVIPKPRVMPQGGRPGPKPPTEAGQLAFLFFETLVEPLVNTRLNPEYKKLLYVLPAYSTSDNPISLDLIASECRGILADIAEVQAAQAKPARGKIIR